MTATVELDPFQRRVATLGDDEDAVVLGAAGTGKTTAAVELVAERVLGPGWDPGAILVIAADRRAASRLRDRLLARLGVPTPGGMIRTVQSLANSIVLDHAKSTGLPLPLYLSGADHDRTIRALIDEEPVDVDAGHAAWPGISRATRLLPAFRSELRALLAEASVRGLGPDELVGLGERHGRPAWTATGRFMRRLGERIERDHPDFTPLDAAFVLRRATELVAEPHAGLGALRLLVVDDAQELGHGGLALLRAIAGRIPLDARVVRAVLVGDPDLATGGFRGARPGAFASAAFWAPLGEPQRLVLGQDHRHGPEVAGALARIVARIGVAGEAPHRAPAVDASRADAVHAVRVADTADQAAYLARSLRERHVHDGVPWSELGVVVRTAGAANRLARELRSLQVPAAAAGAAPVDPEDYAVRGLMLPLEIALGMVELDAERAEALLTGSLGRLDAVAIRRLRVGLRLEALKAGRDTTSHELLLEAMRRPGAFSVVESPTARRARAVAELLESVTMLARSRASIEELLWALWDGSGLAREWGSLAFGTGVAADEANRHLDIVVELFAAARRYVERHPEGGAEAFIRSWLDTTVRRDTLARRAPSASVFVGTPAQAVGLEFDTVLLAELEEGTWPNLRVRGSLLGVQDFVDVWDRIDPATLDRRRETLHDELRLLALAVSRARSRLVAVGVVGEEHGASPFLRLIAPDGDVRDAGPDAVTPLTLRALTARLRRELTSSRDLLEPGRALPAPRARELAAAQGLALLAAAGIPGADPAEWYGLAPVTTLEPLVPEGEPVRISPSTLDRFGACELHWVIEHLGGIGSSLGASVGTIVHAVAETIEDEPVEALLPGVLDRLDDLHFDAAWLRDAEARRAAALLERLVAYQRDLAAARGVTVGRELRFRIEAGRAEVRGRIDRIERFEDDVAVVVDFKTGKESAFGSDASVAEHAQLATYQLALLDGGLEDAEGRSLDLALRNGGARLVILSRGSARTRYVAPHQQALDEAAAAAWRTRIADTAERMAGAVFVARVESHCSNRYAYGPCEVHIVPAVSA